MIICRMAQLSDDQKAAMGGGPNAVVEVGDSWTEGDPPEREVLEPGDNSPEIVNLGWSVMIRRMLSARGVL